MKRLALLVVGLVVLVAGYFIYTPWPVWRDGLRQRLRPRGAQ